MTTATAEVAQPRRAVSLRKTIEAGGPVWLLVVVLFAVAAFASEDFRRPANLANLSLQSVTLALVALGQFLVVLTAGIDLSIGSTVRLASILAAITMGGSNLRLAPAVLVALGVGAAAGGLNGFSITKLRVPPFVTTLGTLAILQGVALFIAPQPKGRTGALLTRAYYFNVWRIPLAVIIVALVWLLVWFLLNRTRWGRHVYAIGGNAEVARLSGINTERVRFTIYVAAGLLAGLGGLFTVARAGVGDPNAGSGLEFESLAAVVIGGVSLFGGRGRMLGVLGGVVLLGMISNIFNLVGIEVWYQQLLKGAIILVAGAAYVNKGHVGPAHA